MLLQLRSMGINSKKILNPTVEELEPNLTADASASDSETAETSSPTHSSSLAIQPLLDME